MSRGKAKGGNDAAQQQPRRRRRHARPSCAEQEPREPDRRVQLVDVSDVREQEPTQAETEGADPGGKDGGSQPVPQEQVHAGKRQPDVEQHAPRERRGKGEQREEGARRVEDAGLYIREQWGSEIQKRIPEWKLPLADQLANVGLVRVDEHDQVEAADDALPKDRLPKEDERQEQEAAQGNEVDEDRLSLFYSHLPRYWVVAVGRVSRMQPPVRRGRFSAFISNSRGVMSTLLRAYCISRRSLGCYLARARISFDRSPPYLRDLSRVAA